MGVEGLQNFLTISKLGDSVNLGELIKQQLSETGKTPIVIIDGSSCTSTFCKDSANWLYGGQLKQIYRRMLRFIDKIRQSGGKVVAFYDGVPSTKWDNWIKKRKDKCKTINRFFSADSHLTQFPTSAMYIVTRNAFLFRGCSVYNSLKNTEEEISQYATANDCLAVVAQDTNYVIFNGADHYITVNDFNFETLDGTSYNPKKFARYLGLPTSSLPVFASLAGNNVVTREALQKFHALNNAHNGQNFFFNIANMVNKLPLLEYDPVDYFNEHRVEYGDATNAIIESILTYEKKNEIALKVDEKTDWDHFYNTVIELHHFAEIPSCLYSILNQNIFYTNNDIEYLSTIKVCVSDALKPLRQRIYGLLHHNNPQYQNGEKITIKEYCVNNSSFPNEMPESVEAVTPDKFVNMHQLWSDSSDEEEKVALFCHTVSLNLSTDIFDLPSHLIIPISALYYLKNEVKPQFFDDTEIRALVCQAVHVFYSDIKDIKKAKIFNKDKKGMQIASQFLRACETVELLNSVCGGIVKTEDSCPSKYFDGRLFHSAYTSLDKSNESYSDLELQISDFLKLDKINNVQVDANKEVVGDFRQEEANGDGINK